MVSDNLERTKTDFEILLWNLNPSTLPNIFRCMARPQLYEMSQH